MIHRFTGGKSAKLPLIALFAAVGAGGFVAGLTAVPNLAKINVSDTLDLRFPAEWVQADVPETTYDFAKADLNPILFHPRSTYPAVTQAAINAAASLDQSAQMAGEQAARLSVETTTSSANTVAAISPLFDTAAKVPAKRSNAVLNDQQIAGIKRRLKLNRQQDRYWPAVASELRKIEYKKSQQGAKTIAAVDMSKVDFERLKTAGLPLIKSFSDNQREQLKSLAHLLGLDSERIATLSESTP
jgi:hypothetical protein